MKDDAEYEQSSSAEGYPTSTQDLYWREKEKAVVSTKLYAHICIIASKSPYFAQFFKEKKA